MRKSRKHDAEAAESSSELVPINLTLKRGEWKRFADGIQSVMGWSA